MAEDEKRDWREEIRDALKKGVVVISALFTFSMAGAVATKKTLGENAITSSDHVVINNTKLSPFEEWVLKNLTYGASRTESGVLGAEESAQTEIAEHLSVRKKTGELEAIIKDCRKDPSNYHKRIQGLTRFMDDLSTIGDAKLKVMLINGYVNSVIDYDKDKINPEEGWEEKNEGGWFQSPAETMRRGEGICGDMAVLKEALVRIALGEAFYKKNVSIHTLSLDYKGKPYPAFSQDRKRHTVLIVKLDGTLYVLDNLNSRPEAFQNGEPVSPSAWQDALISNSALVSADDYYGEKEDYDPSKQGEYTVLGNGRVAVLSEVRKSYFLLDINKYAVLYTDQGVTREGAGEKSKAPSGAEQIAGILAQNSPMTQMSFDNIVGGLAEYLAARSNALFAEQGGKYPAEPERNNLTALSGVVASGLAKGLDSK